MLTLGYLGDLIATRRRSLGLLQTAVARDARVSLPTLKSLEQGRASEVGFSKIARILGVLGLELRLNEANQGRPTLEDLEREPDDRVSGDGR